jgi:hypothetical protein
MCPLQNRVLLRDRPGNRICGLVTLREIFLPSGAAVVICVHLYLSAAKIVISCWFIGMTPEPFNQGVHSQGVEHSQLLYVHSF